MPRFFVRSTQIANNVVRIEGEDVHHISRALRMAAGEHITVCDMQRNEYDCVLTEFLPDAVLAEIVGCQSLCTEPPCRITLYQALPKGDKLDTVIQKAVECGAFRIVPFVSERCVAQPKPEAEQRKTERRGRIALEAAKQCGRGIVPQVCETVHFDEMLAMAGKADKVFFCYEGDDTLPIGLCATKESLQNGCEIALVIGSEGGFSLAEANAAREKGFIMTGLGPRILRTETASSFALACLCYVLELS